MVPAAFYFKIRHIDGIVNYPRLNRIMDTTPYNSAFLADLNRTLAQARISCYVASTGGNLDEALKLYEKNIALSEALFGFLHGLEVAVRNSLHYVLSTDIGAQDWYRHNLQLPFRTVPRLLFSTPIQKMVDNARRKVGSPAPVGKLIAELTFGFWPFLIGGQFHGLECTGTCVTLWT